MTRARPKAVKIESLQRIDALLGGAAGFEAIAHLWHEMPPTNPRLQYPLASASGQELIEAAVKLGEVVRMVRQTLPEVELEIAEAVREAAPSDYREKLDAMSADLAAKEETIQRLMDEVAESRKPGAVVAPLRGGVLPSGMSTTPIAVRIIGRKGLSHVESNHRPPVGAPPVVQEVAADDLHAFDAGREDGGSDDSLPSPAGPPEGQGDGDQQREQLYAADPFDPFGGTEEIGQEVAQGEGGEAGQGTEVGQVGEVGQGAEAEAGQGGEVGVGEHAGIEPEGGSEEAPPEIIPETPKKAKKPAKKKGKK